MENTILILICIEIGMRLLPLLDSLTELINHFIAIGIQKCNAKIQKIAIESETDEEENVKTVMGFVAPASEEKDEVNEDL